LRGEFASASYTRTAEELRKKYAQDRSAFAPYATSIRDAIFADGDCDETLIEGRPIVGSLIKPAAFAWFCFTVTLLAIGLHVGLQVVPADASQGNVGRIFYYHVPNWIAMSCCFLANLGASIVYLGSRVRSPGLALKADAVAVSTAEVGLVFCSLGLITGSIWGRAVWGIWWTWDARLTATLVLWLMYLSYLVLRRVSTGSQTRTLAAVLAIFAYCDVPIVYMSTRWWRTQHPAPVFFGGPNAGLDPAMMPAVTWNIYAWLAWGVLLVSIRYAIELRRQSTNQAETTRALESIGQALR
jgi:heme exporter protein C